jgi:trehalose 6-phosphate phosphatase
MLDKLDLTRIALFLDFDGTLIDIAPTPESITVPGDLVPLLQRIAEVTAGAVAINTGRRIADIDAMLSPLQLVAAGVHGAEVRLSPGGAIEPVAPPLAPALLDDVQRIAGLDPGIVIEAKGYSVAVHYRLAPHMAPRIETALTRVLQGGPDHLVLCPGRMVMEIVPKQVSKGAALAMLMRLPRFAGRRPVMIGDDVSDRTAFEEALRLGGAAKTVAGELYSANAADFSDPTELRAWLAGLMQ